MPVPSPRSKLLPARGNVADLQANVSALVDGEICYAIDENAYYQKVGSSLVKVSGGAGDGGSYDDTALAARVTTNEGDITTLQTDVGGLDTRVTANEGDVSNLQTAVAGLSNYDDTALTGRVETLENEMDAVEATVAGLSNYDDTVIQGQVSQNATDIAANAAAIQTINETGYDDSALAARVTTNEADISTNAAAIQAINEGGYDDSALTARLDTNESEIDTLQSDVTTLQGETAGLVDKADVVSYNLTAQGSTAYRFTGPGLDGDQNPTVYLVRGQTYRFVNAMNAHGFEIRVEAGGAAYNDGVTNNGATNDTVEFIVPMDAPETLAYQCVSHPAMVGTFQVLKESTAESYDDTALAARVTTNEGDISSLQTTVGGLNNYDDTALAGRVTTAESDIDALESTVGGLTNYDDTALAARVTTAEGDIDALESTVGGLTNYDDTALAGRVTQNESDIAALQAGGGGGGAESIFDLTDVEKLAKPGGYGYSALISQTAAHLEDPTTLPAGQAAFTPSGGSSAVIYLNPVDVYGVDRTADIQAETGFADDPGDLFFEINGDGTWIQGVQNGGVFQEANGLFSFVIDAATETAIAPAVDAGLPIVFSAVANPPSTENVDPEVGDVLKWNGSDFVPGEGGSGGGGLDIGKEKTPAIGAKEVQRQYPNGLNPFDLQGMGNDMALVPNGSFVCSFQQNNYTQGFIAFSLKDAAGRNTVELFEQIQADQGVSDKAIRLRGDFYGTDFVNFRYNNFSGYDLDASNGWYIADGTTPEGLNNCVVVVSQLAWDQEFQYGDAWTYITRVDLYGDIDTPIPAQDRETADNDDIRYDAGAEKFVSGPGGILGASDVLTAGSPRPTTRSISFSNLTISNFVEESYTWDANSDMTAQPPGSWAMEEDDSYNNYVVLHNTDDNGVNTLNFFQEVLFAQNERVDYNITRSSRTVDLEYQLDDGPIKRIRTQPPLGYGSYGGSEGVFTIDASGNGDNGYTWFGEAKAATMVFLQEVVFELTQAIFPDTGDGSATLPTKLTIYEAVPDRNFPRDGQVLAFNAPTGKYIPQNAFVMTHILNTPSDKDHYWPQSDSAPGFEGEVRIDMSPVDQYSAPPALAIYVGGKWYQWDLLSLSGGTSA